MSGELKAVGYLVGSILGAVFASVYVALAGLLALMVLDLISGVVANGKRRKLDPAIGWGGWKRKTNTIMFVLAVAIFQAVGQTQGVTGIPAAEVVAGGFALVELLSVMRNLTLVGGRMPKLLQGAFAKVEEEVLSTPPDPPPSRRIPA